MITAKRNMERILSKVKIQRLGSRQAKMAHNEPIATDADTMWRLGMMGALGIFVRSKNTDKGNRS